MYEVQKHNVILARILRRIPENEDVRPSSPLYIQASATAKEFETVYGELDYTLDQAFPTSAGRKYLIKDAQTYQIAPYPATHAVIEGEFDREIAIGTRFTKDGVGFVVTGRLDRLTVEKFYYELQCEEPGEIGNVLSGVLLPAATIPGLTHALVNRILIPGEEEEDTESFRERYLASFTSKRFGGNLSDYIGQMVGTEGVGRVKILRCENFEGELDPEWVGIVFTNSQDEKPSQELVDRIQEEMHPLGVTGLPELETSGLGLAPIQHLVHVRGVEEDPIRVGLKLTLEADYTWDRVKPAVEEALNGYFKSLAESWGDTTPGMNARRPKDTYLTITRSRIESLLIDLDGILDANDTMIDEEFENYDLAWDAIPVLGSVYQHSETEHKTGINSCPYNCPDCIYQRDRSLCERVGG